MADTDAPPLFDEERGLREIARVRLRRDELTRGQVHFGDRLAEYMQRHFSAEETEAVGRALLIAASASASVIAEGLERPEVIVNIIGFAGARMIRDGREWLDAQGAGDG